jgi:YidC/Oxa1 family membrane protein insertase
MNIFNLILIEPLANGLVLFYRLLGSNMGMAIIGFTIFLRLLLNPLTKPYMDSMKKMKDFGPELSKLKAKHGGDKIKFAQAQADFYKQKGINPGAGCLPYLLQIVVLIAFFNVFTRTISGGGDLVAKFNPLLYQPLKFAASETVHTRFLYLDITKPDIFKFPGLPFPIPGPILILAAVVQLVSSKLMAPVIAKEKKVAKKTPGSTDDMQAAMQQSMTYTFPLFTIIFGMSFPSGLAIYWFLFSFMQMLQQLNIKDLNSLKALIGKINLVKSKA